eukprot:scaffold68_cov128-Isochrysis_galbana.AAC.2
MEVDILPGDDVCATGPRLCHHTSANEVAPGMRVVGELHVAAPLRREAGNMPAIEDVALNLRCRGASASASREALARTKRAPLSKSGHASWLTITSLKNVFYTFIWKARRPGVPQAQGP